MSTYSLVSFPLWWNEHKQLTGTPRKGWESSALRLFYMFGLVNQRRSITHTGHKNNRTIHVLCSGCGTLKDSFPANTMSLRGIMLKSKAIVVFVNSPKLKIWIMRHKNRFKVLILLSDNDKSCTSTKGKSGHQNTSTVTEMERCHG